MLLNAIENICLYLFEISTIKMSRHDNHRSDSRPYSLEQDHLRQRSRPQRRSSPDSDTSLESVRLASDRDTFSASPSDGGLGSEDVTTLPIDPLLQEREEISRRGPFIRAQRRVAEWLGIQPSRVSSSLNSFMISLFAQFN